MSGTSFEGLRIEEGGGIGHLILDRPPVNAISTAMYRGLADACRALASTATVDVVVVRSARERLFCGGADLREVEKVVTDETGTLDAERQALARAAYEALRGLAQPTIAVVNGPAIGAGAVIASCCDIRVASRNASVVLAEINVARCGGGRYMMRHFPQGVVRQMFFTGEPMDATMAQRFGFFSEVCPVGDEVAVGLRLAEAIAAKSPAALRLGKLALNGCEDMPVHDGYEFEQQRSVKLGRLPDAREAVRAFLEKRPPVWERF